MIAYEEETKAQYFEGFQLPEGGTNYAVTMPINWPDVAKAIDNLAELKVVQMVLWVTWGNGRPDGLESLTIDDFMECTGLSKQSVRTGVEKALEHGYIVRQIEYFVEDGNVHQVRYYGLKLCQAQDNDVVFGERDEIEYNQDVDEGQEVSLSGEMALEADFYEGQDVGTFSNEFERNIHNNTSGDIIRIQEDDNNLDTDQTTLPCSRLQALSQEDNITLCCRVESHSSDLGDVEHTASNIGQTRRILARFLASGGNFEAFLLLMQQAKETTQKKSGIKHTNSNKKRNAMPYYFACLRNAASATTKRVAV